MDFTHTDRISWIFFDLDDTIWDFSSNSALALNELYHISPILKKLFSSPNEFTGIYHVNNKLMWDLYSKGKVTTPQLKLERWRRTLATKQFEVLTAVCEELEANYLDILARGREKFVGVDEILGSLSKQYLLAILSNGFLQTQYKKLEFSGLNRYITRTIVSEEIGINKPDQRIFNYAVAETGATKPLLMVGDHPETDVLGAMKAGWHAIWFNPANNPSHFSRKFLQNLNLNPELYVGEVNNMKQLKEVIDNFFKKH